MATTQRDRFVLSARVDALRHGLRLAAGSLGNPAIETRFRDRVDVLFRGQIERQLEQLEDLARALGAPDGTGGAETWRRFEECAGESDAVLRECRAFIQGALMRTAGLDHGVCDLADAFLEQLARLTVVEWRRFTIVADGEFFAPLSGIIRVRYPDFSVWNLPVLAHEFGHFAMPLLKDPLRGSDPIGRFRTAARNDVAARLPPRSTDRIDQFTRHLDEFIADSFAVYAAGPSFVATCVLLRFDPLHAHEEGPDHPSDARRAYLMLKLLDALSPDYAKVRARLAALWDNMLAAAGTTTDSHDEWLDGVVGALGALFRTLAPTARLHGDDWRRAVELSEYLTVSSPGPVDVTLVTPRDLLNATWIRRLEQVDEAAQISVRALDIARSLATTAVARATWNS